MANSSAKKLIKSNASRLSRLRLTIFISSFIYILIRFLRRPPLFDRFHLSLFPIFLLFQLIPYYFLWSAARPRYFDDGSLQYGGEDISQAGILEYAHDLIYVAVAVQLAVLITKWAVLLAFVLPVYAIVVTCFGGSGGGEEEALEDDGVGDSLKGLSRKERRKAVRESRKVK